MTKTSSTVVVSARIPDQLASRVAEQTVLSGESFTSFLIEAIQNECDRRTMSKPKPQVDLVHILGKLQDMHDLTSRVETQNRLILANQALMKHAIGIEDPS